MPYELKDRSEQFFGRKHDLAALKDRVGQPGVTPLIGRPQMGKSWLLQQLAYELSAGDQPNYMVGFAESYGQSSDLLLRAIEDLYQRMLSNASYLKQAKLAWKQQKKNWLEAVTSITSTIASTTGPISGKFISELLKGLVAANQELKTGGIYLQKLTYEQARDLIQAIAIVDDRPIVLFLDQWEQSANIKLEVDTLNAVLRHAEDWPSYHIFLGIRSSIKIPDYLYDTVQCYTECEPYHIPELDLQEEDLSRLDSLLRNKIHIDSEVSKEVLVSLIKGYPGVIYRWLSFFRNKNATSREGLEREARIAHENRFPEILGTIKDLSDDSLGLVIRLAYLPLCASSSGWRDLKDIILFGAKPGDLDRLKVKNILESVSPPTFGHDLRWEAFRKNLESHFMTLCSCELINVILKASEQISKCKKLSDVKNLLYSIYNFYAIKNTFFEDCAILSLIISAHALVGDLSYNVDEVSTLLKARESLSQETGQGSVGLLAMGLFNTHLAAQQEGDLSRRDALLKELRALATAWPDDAAVRENLAMGLFNTLNAAQQEGDLSRRDALLKELRALATAWPDDAAVRENLAMGLFNTLHAAQQEGDLSRRDALLEELRALATAWPDDAAVREALKRALEEIKGRGGGRALSAVVRWVRDAFIAGYRRLRQP